MRARNIKPGFFKNEVLGAADAIHAVTYAGLWCIADCMGRLEDRPGRIHVEVNAWRPPSVTEASLDWLAANHFIHRYEVGGERYIWIVKFRKHQHPHVKELQRGSALPPPPDPTPDQHRSGPVSAPDQHRSGPSDSGFLIPDSGSLKPETGSRIADVLNPEDRAREVDRSRKRAMGSLKDPTHTTWSDEAHAISANVSVDIVRSVREELRRVQ